MFPGVQVLEQLSITSSPALSVGQEAEVTCTGLACLAFTRSILSTWLCAYVHTTSNISHKLGGVSSPWPGLLISWAQANGLTEKSLNVEL